MRTYVAGIGEQDGFSYVWKSDEMDRPQSCRSWTINVSDEEKPGGLQLATRIAYLLNTYGDGTAQKLQPWNGPENHQGEDIPIGRAGGWQIPVRIDTNQP